MNTQNDLTELRKVAKSATQDFWWHDLVGAPGQRPEDKEWVVDSNPTFICSTQVGTKRGEQDALHIATFDPPTVLALIDRVEELQAALESAQQYIQTRTGETLGERIWRSRAEAAEATIERVRAAIVGWWDLSPFRKQIDQALDGGA